MKACSTLRHIKSKGFVKDRLTKCYLAASVFFFGLVSQTNAQTVALVKDIYAGTFNSNPQNFTNVSGELFFSATTAALGSELYKSDGTTAGTGLVKDIDPTPGVGSAPVYLVSLNNILYFSANDGINGQELWRSDGTAAGTYMVADINTSTAGASANPSFLTVVNGAIYFQADDGVHGIELWKSDGTTAGTVLLDDIYAGPNSSSPTNLTVAGTNLFFAANNSVNGNELWISNGTTAGTNLVLDIYPGFNNSNPANLVYINGELYFSATNGTNGIEPWTSNGTAAGTTMLKDIYAGATSSNPTGFTYTAGTTFFAATNAANGTELWNTNGTTAGTALLKDIRTGGASSNPTYLTAVNNLLYFSANDGTHGNELWTSGGTAANTVLLDDIYSGVNSSNPADLYALNNILYFQANNGSIGIEFWSSNGSTSGTVNIDDINPGAANSNPGPFYAIGNTLFFAANNGTNGNELWKYVPLVCTPPTLTLTPTGSTGCVGTGQSASVTIANTQANVYYQPFVGANPVGASIDGGGTISLTMLTSALVAGNNTITVGVSSPGCPASTLTSTATVVVNNPPTITQNITGSIVCQGDSAKITLKNPQTGVYYQPFVAGNAAGDSVAGGIANPATMYVEPGFLTPGYVTVNVEATIAGCPAVTLTDTATVHVLAAPTAPTTQGASNCGPASLMLTASGAPVGGSYQWYTAATGATAINGQTTTSYTTPLLSATTTYYVASINSIGCISTTRTPVTATINPVPSAPTTTGGSNCGPGTVTLTASGTPTGGTYNWYAASTGGTILFTGASFTTPSISTTTTYYATEVSAASCESATRTAAVATINTVPAAPTTTGASNCGPGTVSLTASGAPTGGTYHWYAAATGGSSLFTGASFVTPSISTTTTYYAVAVSAASCESATRTAAVATINTVPSAPTTTGASNCGPGTLTLTASGTPTGGTYNWYASATGGTILFTGASYTTPSISATTTYYATEVSAASCESATRTATVATINTVPSAPTTSGASNCGPGTITLTASGTPTGGTYNWYASATGGTKLFTGASYTTPSISATTTYYATEVSAASCESSTRTAAVATINTVPAAPTTTGASNCGPGTLTLTGSGAPTGGTYNWYAAPTGGTILFTGASYSTPSLSNTATYYASSVSSATCESITRTAAVATINTIPAVPTILVDGKTNLCPGDSVILSAPTGYQGYIWSNSSTSSSLTVKSSGSFTVKVTTAAGCTSGSSAAVAVTLSPAPSTPVIVNSRPLTFCSGDSTLLSVSSVAQSYRWSNGDTTAAITVHTPGSYTVTTRSVAGCISALSSPAVVNVNPTPAVPVINASSTTICGNDSAILTAPVGFASYKWSNAATTSGISVKTSGTFTVQVTSGAGCQSPVSAPVSVTQTPSPGRPVLTSPQTAICQGDSLILTASSGFTGYHWSTGDTTVSIKVKTAGAYYVEGKYCGGLFSTPSDTVNISLNALPAVPVVSATKLQLCPGDSSVLTVNVPVNTQVWWTGGQTGTPFTVKQAGLYSAKAVTLAGCSSAYSLPVNINQFPAPAQPGIAANGPLGFCTGGTVTLSAPSGYVSYLWSNGDTLANVSASTTGSYSVKVSQGGKCFSLPSAPLTVTVSTQPAQPVISSSAGAQICQGSSTLLSGPIGLKGYLWSNGDTTASISVSNSGTYTLQVKSGPGCSSVLSVPFNVTVNALPATPVVTQTSGDTLNATPGLTSYLWLLNGSLQTATSDQLIAQVSGLYRVIGFQNGCASDTSAPLSFVATGITSSTIDIFEAGVYPNPANAGLNVRWSSATGSRTYLTLTDEVGHQVLSKQNLIPGEGQIELLDVSGLPRGVYLLTIGTDTNVKRFKVTLQ